MATHVAKLCRSASSLIPRGGLSGYLRPAAGRRAFSETSNGSSSYEEGEEAASTPVNSGPNIQDNPYHGISAFTFQDKVVQTLLAPVNESDVEIKPDGLIYLPEIKYRRILNNAFGPGGWALMPRGEIMHFQNEHEGAQLITREYALYCRGRFVSQAMGEHTLYSKNNLPYGKACESAKSNALMRCCKDLGVASELWDPQFITKWKGQNAVGVWCENQRTREKKKLWKRKDATELFPYPWKASSTSS